nr:DNA replication licensing factor MCM4 [Seculamonas ecuadoriensis]
MSSSSNPLIPDDLPSGDPLTVTHHSEEHVHEDVPMLDRPFHPSVRVEFSYPAPLVATVHDTLTSSLHDPMLSSQPHSGDVPLISEETSASRNEQTLVWGTNIVISESRRKIRAFLHNFKRVGETEPFYVGRYLPQLHTADEVVVNIDCSNIFAYDETLYNQLVRFPQEVIPLFDLEVTNLFTHFDNERQRQRTEARRNRVRKANLDRSDGAEPHSAGVASIGGANPTSTSQPQQASQGTNPSDPSDSDDPPSDNLGMSAEDRIHRQVQCRMFNLQRSKPMRDLDPSDIDQLVSIRGMVTRCSSVIPEIRVAHLACVQCRKFIDVPVDRGRIDEPTRCLACGADKSMSLIHNQSIFFDKQLIKMQEAPESIPEGETPHTVNACCFHDLVDYIKPGDRVEITGIYRAVPIRVNTRQRTVKSIFRTYLDVVHFKKMDKRRLQSEYSHEVDDSEFFATIEESDPLTHMSADKERELRELSGQPDIYERLVASFAPSIWELDDVKKGILCQLFGGSNKELRAAGNTKYRGEINVLLVGDPGVSKSQLLQFVHRIAPRGIYTSGKGSSAVGLTAYVTKDPDTKESVLESGALVLSDRGICCIDEFDKMNDATRSILHEAMEQQTVSIAKAGIVATLNARTSILASANPVGSRYNRHMSIVENIQLPPTLLSRFDLIYLLLDYPNEQKDRALAQHLVSLYTVDGGAAVRANGRAVPSDRMLSVETLTQYISFARRHVHPVLSDAAAQDLQTVYLELRQMGNSRHSITATPRQLESLIRLSEAHARMRFSAVVERMDVAEAVRLLRVALHQAALDPTTGTIDMDKLITGRSAADRANVETLAREVENFFVAQRANAVPFYKLLGQLSAGRPKPVSADELREALAQLEEDNVIVMEGAQVVKR